VRNCSLAWGDYDGDGNLDLAIAGNASGFVLTSAIYRNNGDGTFTDINAGLTGMERCSLSWGDYNSDDYPDLAIAGLLNGSDTQTSKIYRNNGDGTFTDINADLTGVAQCSVAWGNYDNDDDLDLAIAGFTGTGFVAKIYRNDGLCGDANGDTDIDGADDCKDNCLDVPNGPALGTCTAGVTGTCTADAGCDTTPGSGDGVCSANQEDTDGDWVGDVCDNCPFEPNGPNDYGNQMDLDGDNDVDQSDLGLFQRCMIENNYDADPNCAS